MRSDSLERYTRYRLLRAIRSRPLSNAPDAADECGRRYCPAGVADTRPVEDEWTHIGRLWTNGGPYLVVDSGLRHLWLGFSEDEYFDRVVDLGAEEAAITLGHETAAVVGADGAVRDESWMEVFESTDGTIAIVQASGDGNLQALAAALRYAEAPTHPSTVSCCRRRLDNRPQNMEHHLRKTTRGYSSQLAALRTKSTPACTPNSTAQAVSLAGVSSQSSRAPDPRRSRASPRQMSALRGFLGHHVPVDISNLAGSFVVEIGIRQAWPFIGFCDNRLARSRETRLYIDAAWAIDAAVVHDVEDDERWLLTAARLNGATVVGAYVGTDGALNVETDEGHALVVSGEATASTVGEPWWFSGWFES